jgi:hypothetical protein
MVVSATLQPTPERSSRLDAAPPGFRKVGFTVGFVGNSFIRKWLVALKTRRFNAEAGKPDVARIASTILKGLRGVVIIFQKWCGTADDVT